jgi:hypothetical protein
MILKRFAPILGEFKWYRKLIGGTWYQVYDFNSDLGIAGDTIHWTHKNPDHKVEILKVEKYS